MDDWNIIYEKVEPHGLCCEKCKQSRVLLADAKDALRYFGTEWEPDVPDVSPEDCDALLARIEELEGRA